MSQRVLVTGSSGLLGSAVACRLRRDGWEVVGVDRRPGAWTTCECEIGDLAGDAALHGTDAVVHAAALHAPHVGEVADGEFWSVNVHATEALLDQARRCGVRRFVHTSSTSVYGHALVPTDRAVWVTEALAPEPRDIYDTTKLAAERLTAAASDAAMSTVSLRVARCFPEPLRMLATHRLHRGVGIADVAAAHLLALQAESFRGTYNIAGPYPFRQEDAVALWTDARAVLAERDPRLVEEFGRRRWPLPRRIDRIYVSEAATRDLGYDPSGDALSVLRAE